MNLELNGENNRSKRDAYSKVTRRRFRSKRSETRATAGVGEIKILFTVGNTIRKSIIAADIVGSTLGTVVTLMNRDAISEENRFALQMLALAASLPQIARISSKFDKFVTKLDNILNEANNIGNAGELSNYIIKLRNKFAIGKNLDILLNGTGPLANLYNKLPDNMKVIFRQDFSNYSDEMLELLNKQDSDFFQIWKKFRQEGKVTICN